MENTKKNKGSPPKSEMDFGMVDLGGGDAEEEKPLAVDAAPALAKPAPATRAPAAAPKAPSAAPKAPAAAAPQAPAEGAQMPKSRPASRYEPLTVSLPPRPLIPAGALKIILLVLVIAGAIAGAVWGVIKWREHVNAEEMAEKQSLDQRSLDSLREKVLRQEGAK